MLPVVFLIIAASLLVVVLFLVWQSVRTIQSDELFVSRLDATADRAALLDEKNALLRSIKDLEFERGVGKIDDEDFARLDAKYRARAKEVLRLLDVDLGEWLAKAEALVEERLRSVTTTPVVEVKAEEVASLVCAKCTTKNDSDAAFCKKCGQTLRGEAS